MKLVVPYIGELLGQDRRFIRLAEFLGISCVTFPLERDAARQTGYFETAFPDEPACFVVNPQVMKDWLGGDSIPMELVSVLLSRFPHLLVHGLRLDAFDSKTAAALSRGRLQSIEAIDGKSLSYDVAKDSQHVCGAFSGLSFGSANPTNDHVFSWSVHDRATQEMILIGGRPFMALVKDEGSEVLFLASEDVADLDAEADDISLVAYFSRFVPHAMALRHVFVDDCWRPHQHHASIIIDDPLLRRNYGFLNFEYLLALAKQHNFHAAVAFIPYNFRRNSPRITRLFRENSKWLSICFHGNDHLGAEFASLDPTLLNTMVHIAEKRMNSHREMNDLSCDRVMVFPQGNFSVEAMEVLKSNNFYAAVNTVPYPTQRQVHLTIAELAQPAVLRYGGFPLFLRHPIKGTESHDIAFKLFFGRPILIVMHHDDFQRPELLTEMVSRINSIEPEIRWSNLASVVSNSVLWRKLPNGRHDVRAYSGSIGIENNSSSLERFSIEWTNHGYQPSVGQVLKGGAPCRNFQIDDAGIRVSVELAPCTSETVAVVYQNCYAMLENLSFKRNIKAFLRRRLSEIRDNHLSKNPRILAIAKTFVSSVQRFRTSM